MLSVLLVDDDVMLLKAARLVLEGDGARVHAFSDPVAALQSAGRNHYDLVIADMRMPGMDGLQLLARVRDVSPSAKRVLVSAYREFDSIIHAFNDGLLDRFLIKPWQPVALVRVVRSCMKATSPLLPDDDLDDGPALLPATLGGVVNFHGMLSADPVMLRLFEFVARTARTGGPFHICGETGTGKELVAKAVHAELHGRQKPFFAVNCANFSPSMLESQLFGHRKGAFTGAVSDQPGYLEAADGGTLFLDEVTELPLGLQAKLLRVLQEREYTRLGDTKPRSIDVTVVSAGQVPLDEAVRNGSFRADLKYRLDVLSLRIPPLRERGGDVVLLFNHFLKQTWERLQGAKDIRLSRETRDVLLGYPWPGNVRELMNIATYVCAMLSDAGGEVTPALLPQALTQATRQAAPAAAVPAPAPRLLDKQSILEALEANNQNKSAAARSLGISRMTLWRHIKS